MTFEELLNILKDENGEPLRSFELQDLDGNTIYGDELFILDYYSMREWKVSQINIRDDGHATIILSSGNFKDWHFRNTF